LYKNSLSCWKAFGWRQKGKESISQIVFQMQCLRSQTWSKKLWICWWKKIYCKNHLKEVQGSTGASGSFISAPGSFIPENSSEKITEKSATPEHIASKFKGMGDQADKCKSCGKTVYATEKVSLQELKGISIYHKSCLKCSVCSIKLDVSTYGSSAGVIFCKVHLKQYGKPEQVKSDNVFFISPLANKGDYVAGPRDQETSDSRYDDERPTSETTTDNDDRIGRTEEREPQREPEESQYRDQTTESELDTTTQKETYSSAVEVDEDKRREDDRRRKKGRETKTTGRRRKSSRRRESKKQKS